MQKDTEDELRHTVNTLPSSLRFEESEESVFTVLPLSPLGLLSTSKVLFIFLFFVEIHLTLAGIFFT